MLSYVDRARRKECIGSSEALTEVDPWSPSVNTHMVTSTQGHTHAHTLH